MSALFDLTGRAILVTGASRGIGFAMAEALAQHGATVVLNARDPAALEVKAAALRAAGWKAETAVFDVTDEAAGTAAMNRITERHGALHGLINNAGIQHRSPVLEFATDDFEHVASTNLTSCFVLCREAIRLMSATGGGGSSIPSRCSDPRRARPCPPISPRRKVCAR